MTDEDFTQQATQFDTVEDGHVVRTVGAEVARLTKWTNRVEVILIAIAALSLVILAVAQLKTSTTNKKGVDRIIDCTTEGHDCYEEQQQRSGDLIADVVLQLNESHLVIECILFTVPSARDESTEEACRTQAQHKTAELRRQLEETINKRSEEAKRRNGK